jgi:hypothetical protein
MAAQDPSWRERTQRLIDQAAQFHVYLAPDRASTRAAPRDATAGVTGIDGDHTVRRFDLDLEHAGQDVPSGRSVVGETIGRASLRWAIVPEEYIARPDREPPPTPRDTAVSQRFTIQPSTFTFGDGRDGFRIFGAGRTFPMWTGSRGVLWAAAVADVIDGFGAFRGHVGNLTICGDFVPDGGFVGHMIVRIVDHNRTLRADTEPPPPERAERDDVDVSYLTWIGQKASDRPQENSFSLTPDGQVRGLNIPVDLKTVSAGLASTGSTIRARDFRTGGVIGLEVGFGRESLPRTAASGSPLFPNRFEGVSRYAFYGRAHDVLGTLTTNVLEGRSFNVALPGAETEPALRFGYFGFVAEGTGCFDGVRGMLYGAAGSVFAPPPYQHLISNLYVLRLMDPSGRFRTG